MTGTITPAAAPRRKTLFWSLLSAIQPVRAEKIAVRASPTELRMPSSVPVAPKATTYM